MAAPKHSMRNFQSAARKWAILAFFLLAATGYIILAAREYLAAHFATHEDLRSLQLAVRLEPNNAKYHYLLGRYYWFVQRSPDAAIGPYQTAIRLNPFDARTWFDLAAVYQYQGRTDRQEDALQHAIEEDPTTPEVAWEAANLYAVQGETDKALKEFRVVLENDPYRPPAALRMCWRIDPDIDVLLAKVVPPLPKVYSWFLELLVSQKQTSAAAKVWSAIAQLNQPIERGDVLGYVRYLITAHDVDQAQLVWQQASSLCQLSAYQPTSANLVVNGDFSLDMMNGGFDWAYHQSPDISLALDPTQPHTGNRSLRLVFDSRGFEDAGIQHLILVQPKTEYEFSANFRSENMEGAGGPRFVLQDLYSGIVYFTSDSLNADFWRNVSGDFTTGPDTKLLLLRIQRFPAGDPIKGTLWIDGVRLTAAQTSVSGKNQ